MAERREWRTEPDGPGSGDDRYGNVPAQEEAELVDLAKVDPCPGCGTPTRRMGGVPIAGSGLDLVFSGPWWCDDCLQAKTDAAVADIERVAS